MTDQIITQGRTFNFLPYNATTNPYGLGGDGHNTIAPGETISNFFLLMQCITQDVLASSNTSLTSNSIGTGSKTFTVATDFAYEAYMDLKIMDAAAPATNYMFGYVTAYNSSTLALTVTITSIVGSGTKTSWTIVPSGATGATGSAGATYDISASSAITALADAYTLAVSDGSGSAANKKITITNFLATLCDPINLNDNALIRPEIKDYSETHQTVAAASTTVLDFEAGNVITLTQNTNISTFTWSNPSPTGKSCSFTLRRVKDNSGTSRTIAWPASVKWAAATAPTLTQTANAVDIFSFFTVDAGTTWYGFVAGQAMA